MKVTSTIAFKTYTSVKTFDILKIRERKERISSNIENLGKNI